MKIKVFDVPSPLLVETAMQDSTNPPKGGNRARGGNGGNRATGGNGARGGKGPKASQGKSDETRGNKDAEAPIRDQKPKASNAQHRAMKGKAAEIQIRIEMPFGGSVRVEGNPDALAKLLAQMSVRDSKTQSGSETGHKLDSNKKGLSRFDFDSQMQIVASAKQSTRDFPGCLWASDAPVEVRLPSPVWVFIFGCPAGQADIDPAVSGRETCLHAEEFVGVHGGEILTKARKYDAFDALHKTGKCPIDLMKKAAPRKAAAGGKVSKDAEDQCVAMSEGQRGLAPEFNHPKEAAAAGGGVALQKPAKRSATRFDGGDDVPSL